MKYSELVSFQPIETVIQLKQANKEDTAKQLIQTFVISERLSNVYTEKIIPQLQFDTPNDNKGVFLIGNYGSGK